MSNLITENIFATLNILVLERINIGLFKVSGTVPDWSKEFCRHDLTDGMEILIPQKNFSFLENFLIDAEEFWDSNHNTKISSGLWIDTDSTGKEYYFEAFAVCVDHQKILLIELLDETYKEKLHIIQKGREYQLGYQQLLKDNQKKEVLIHCIVHDIAGQLSAMNCCLSLLEFENLTPKGREYLEVGRKQSIKQETLIREILDAFSTEMESLEGFTYDIEQSPNILSYAQEVIELLQTSFVLNNVQLQLASNIDMSANWNVVADQSRLGRVISNLLENALRYSPPESTVVVGLQQDEKYIITTVDDQGSGVAPELAKTLFDKFTQGKGKSGRSGLGLYFCRITIERWGGSIGYLPRVEGGSRFWFRLPKLNSLQK